MNPFEFTLVTFLASWIAGLTGSLLGLGGGIVVVPVLTLFLHVDIHTAIAASIVCVIATSSGAAVAYVRERLVDLRLGMFLEVATTTGSLFGAFVAGFVSFRFLFVLFGLVLAGSALAMWRKPKGAQAQDTERDPWAARLRLGGAYFDQNLDQTVSYCPRRVRAGFFLMFVAGLLSGLLGIGAGTLKVPAMDLLMDLPIKVSTATSNFMIGVTAAGGALVYWMRGDIEPFVAAPVAAGVLSGAFLGSRILGRLHSRVVRALFVLLMLVMSGQMVLRGLS